MDALRRGRRNRATAPAEPLTRAVRGEIDLEGACALAGGAAKTELCAAAAALRDQSHGQRLTYSRKVFIPLTTYCRDDCGYCTSNAIAALLALAI